jgi:hypothetical protein
MEAACEGGLPLSYRDRDSITTFSMASAIPLKRKLYFACTAFAASPLASGTDNAS